MRPGILALMLGLVAAPSLAAADHYQYTTESGTLAFTDELKRVPLRYRDSAEQRPDRSLESYPRFTPVPRGATYAPSPELLAIPTDEPRVQPVLQPTAKGLEFAAAPGIQLDLDRHSAEPVSVSRRIVWKQGIATRQLVVRRGAEILAIIDQGGYQDE